MVKVIKQKKCFSYFKSSNKKVLKILIIVILLNPISLFSKREDYKTQIYYKKNDPIKEIYKIKSILEKKKDYDTLIKYSQKIFIISAFFRDKVKNKEELINIVNDGINSAREALAIKNSVEARALLAFCYTQKADLERSLSYARISKDILENIIREEPNFMNGIGYTILGKLYYEVPGWPISFGSNKKALEYLEIALKKDKNNPYNYLFMAEILLDEGYKSEAKKLLETALMIPNRKDFYEEDQKCKEIISYIIKKDIID
ncbi:MAG TPA: hypothetical protein PKW55_06810 [Spirochaetota bacterium]|nr:hypothetical protein [Spirochaetota bacterium]HOM38775.1 hypothetical protein [Spirochaetota bacterium]HPQ49573.1 hypothetical protein [Spirochaetota bacterium]